MKHALTTTALALGLALSSCSGDTGTDVVKACDATAAAYGDAMDALGGSQDEWANRLETFESTLSQYGASLGGAEGAAFSSARAKLDAQRTIDDSLSEVNKMCTEAGTRAITDLGN